MELKLDFEDMHMIQSAICALRTSYYGELRNKNITDEDKQSLIRNLYQTERLLKETQKELRKAGYLR